MFNFSSILQAMRDPPMRHSAFVHIPLALTLVGIAMALLAAILCQNKTCRWMAIGVYATLIAACFFTANTGESAHDAITRQLTTAEYQLIDDHEEMAEKLWMFAAGVFVMLALSFIPKAWVRMSASWLAVFGALATALWAAQVGHLGGTLVYAHGVGVKPSTVQNSTAAAYPPDSSSVSIPDAGSQVGSAASSEAQITFFRERVHPILVDHCYKCHNPARVAARKSGRFDQTTREAMLKGGRSGPAIVVGDPEKSLLMKRVKGVDPEDDPMPPPPNERLSDVEIAALEQWIRDGAAWGE